MSKKPRQGEKPVRSEHAARIEASSHVQDSTKLPDIPESSRGRPFTMSARTIWFGEKQLKAARFRHFEWFCDEPPEIGGEDRYPQPLTYLAASVGF